MVMTVKVFVLAVKVMSLHPTIIPLCLKPPEEHRGRDHVSELSCIIYAQHVCIYTSKDMYILLLLPFSVY